MPRESAERIARLYYKYRRELPRLELGRSTWYQPTLCMCVFHWRTIALHSYFSYVAYRRAGRSVPRRRRRCISACDRVSAEYDRPHETRSKTTDTFPRLRLCRGAGTIRAKFPPRRVSARTSANAIVYHCTCLSYSHPNRKKSL